MPQGGQPHRAYYVYLVRCADGTYYAGSTPDLAYRVRLHNAGRGAKYVRGRGPVALVYTKAYRSCSHALKAEWRLKSRTRQQKELLVRGYEKKERER